MAAKENITITLNKKINRSKSANNSEHKFKLLKRTCSGTRTRKINNSA